MLQLCFVARNANGEEQVLPLKAAFIQFTPGEKSGLDKNMFRKGQIMIGRKGMPKRLSRAFDPCEAPWLLDQQKDPNELFEVLCKRLMLDYDLAHDFVERLLQIWRIENRDVPEDEPQTT